MNDDYFVDDIIYQKIKRINSRRKGKITFSVYSHTAYVFIKPNNKRYTAHLLIEGDRIGEPTCPALVYKAINNYLKKWCRLN